MPPSFPTSEEVNVREGALGDCCYDSVEKLLMVNITPQDSLAGLISSLPLLCFISPRYAHLP